ncbi:MAG: endonuclease/exonuclease/phosphatase family protein [Kineosporiaceae bacterium]
MRAKVRSSAMRAVGALVIALGMGTVVPATAHANQTPTDLKVMTRNLYLGADLTPALVATDTASFLGAVAMIYGTAQFTDFPARAEALADEIQSGDPDLVGLQEVTVWETSGPGVPKTQDFLAILQDELSARGLHYAVASVSDNANIGPVPLVSPCAPDTPVGACLVTLKDRDVVLVNEDTPSLYWWGARNRDYTAQQEFTPPVPGAAPISFKRGWASIEASYRGERFRFVNTHLETESFPAVQEAQAAEFLAGPARSWGPVIVTGDFNSAADGSTTTTYATLTQRFRDAWWTQPGDKGLTCCQSGTLTNPASQLSTRIDLVLGRNGAYPISAKVLGATPFQAAPPLWASDHAGVVATVRLSWW